MTNKTVVAQKLLQINAIKINIKQPYTWASGWKSPIYCDNRKILSYPFVRDFIKSELSNLVFSTFNNADLIAGVATAGIPWAVLIADQLKLPCIYVRPVPKAHGLGKQIEGEYLENQNVVVVEDLLSTGKSSLAVVDVLANEKLIVNGVVSIFNYRFNTCLDSFANKGIELRSLSDYEHLVSLLKNEGKVSLEEEKALLNWRANPSDWK
ncbi:MAG: orotate phosphoribosyltransferase [Bacteroidetes bacterium]|nr:orotate phosphoribosyltransferase [Bacteroidota bacterium]